MIHGRIALGAALSHSRARFTGNHDLEITTECAAEGTYLGALGIWRGHWSNE